ncbi:serine hydrolase domain-containing protein [Paenibacillus sp. 481]|uniref:serine hydrolase domain-containing protein n=1 Tax=Paenibacillus sp. 481 TaxID=2835869 RepID=UPI001E4DA634|nr:serine hydrolase [Paenibacillus sp. 481]UHA73685.1 serine hydrolase [Paenibacillus sp. 481]
MLRQKIDLQATEIDFSGVVLLRDKSGEGVEAAYGYANRAEQIANTIHTRFGIASGCKLFTAIGICQLVERGLLSFDSLLADCVPHDFPQFGKQITVHHLLTHSSGIPDYFDEDVMGDFEDLWKTKPMYLMKQPVDFLPMFADLPMMFKPGERFHYNNAGFILLGLIIEQRTGLAFSQYIKEHIFAPCGMDDSGYFSLDRLPQRTAIGYIDNEEDGTWRTNVYSLPITGGADGGAFVTAADMIKLWEALCSYKLLSQTYTDMLLAPHIHHEDDEFYGYGVWITKQNDAIYKWHVMGYDPGVCFHAAIYPSLGKTAVVIANKNGGAWTLTKELEKSFTHTN